MTSSKLLIVYGARGSGKTANLQYLNTNLLLNDGDPHRDLVRYTNLTTKSGPGANDAAEHMHLSIGKVDEMVTTLDVYALPFELNDWSKQLIRTCDVICFIVDSAGDRQPANKEAFRNVQDCCPDRLIPIVVQFNKRDLTDALPLEVLKAEYDSPNSWSVREAVAFEGLGVFSTFLDILRVLKSSLVSWNNSCYKQI